MKTDNNRLFDQHDERSEVYESLHSPMGKTIRMWYLFVLLLAFGIFVILTQVGITINNKIAFAVIPGTTECEKKLLIPDEISRFKVGETIKIRFEDLTDTTSCLAVVSRLNDSSNSKREIIVSFSGVDCNLSGKYNRGAIVFNSTNISILSYLVHTLMKTDF